MSLNASLEKDSDLPTGWRWVVEPSLAPDARGLPRRTWRRIVFRAGALVAVAAAFFGWLAISPPWPSAGEITGRVLDLAGDPVAGARVTVDPGGQVTFSGSDGRFYLSEIPFGIHWVEISWGDESMVRIRVRIPRGESIDLGMARMSSVPP